MKSGQTFLGYETEGSISLVCRETTCLCPKYYLFSDAILRDDLRVFLMRLCASLKWNSFMSR